MATSASTITARRRGPYLISDVRGVTGLTEWTHEQSGRTRWVLIVNRRGVKHEKVVPAGTRTEAKRLAADLRQQIVKGEQSVVAPSKLSFDALFSVWREDFESRIASGERKQSTLSQYAQRYEKFIKPMLGPLRIEDISKSHITKVLSGVRSDGLSSSVQKKVFDICSTVLQHAVDHELVARNVARSLSQRQRPTVSIEKPQRVLVQAEVEALLAAVPTGWRVFFTLLAESGLRVREALALSWAHVDFETNQIKVERQLGREVADGFVGLKTKRSRRSVPITAKLKRELREHFMQSRFKADDDPIFVTSSGKSPGYNNSRRALRSGLAKINLLDPTDERVGAHAFRHYYATTLLRRGVHFTVVSALLGHASPNITLACYEHVIEQLGAADVAAQVEAALGGRS